MNNEELKDIEAVIILTSDGVSKIQAIQDLANGQGGIIAEKISRIMPLIETLNGSWRLPTTRTKRITAVTFKMRPAPAVAGK